MRSAQCGRGRPPLDGSRPGGSGVLAGGAGDAVRDPVLPLVLGDQAADALGVVDVLADLQLVGLLGLEGVLRVRRFGHRAGRVLPGDLHGVLGHPLRAPDGVFGHEVYFDSVSMFIAFLLGGRWLEMAARHRAATATSHAATAPASRVSTS